ncbi:hypothetical protein AAVH_11548 [Aphelenchoides avenae]|nr:hypothetical protein AAVH_11548 [Aphelenchus avenae]
MSVVIPDWSGAQLPTAAAIEGKYVRLEKLDPGKHGDALWLTYCGPDCDPAQFDGLKYGTEATFLLINNAFLLGYRRVEARTSASNVASIKNLERMGFQHEATCRQKQILKGAAVDTSFFSVLGSEWLPIKDACIKWLSDDNQRDGVQKKSLSLILKNRQKSAEAFDNIFGR